MSYDIELVAVIKSLSLSSGPASKKLWDINSSPLKEYP